MAAPTSPIPPERASGAIESEGIDVRTDEPDYYIESEGIDVIIGFICSSAIAGIASAARRVSPKNTFFILN